MKPDRQAGVGKKGMNRDVHITSLDEKSYIFALNSNYESQNGDAVNLQNEESNLLCSRFKSGFKVVGVQKDITADRTYFFLTNPTNGRSEIGFISELEQQTSFTDTIEECDCQLKTVLSEGLENLTQVENCTYTTLIADYECDNDVKANGCLGFDINYPVSSTLKDEKCGKVLYFTDDLNPRRRLEIDRLDQYYKQTVACPTCDCGTQEVDVCINCDKLSIMPKHKPLCMDVKGLVNGGQVRHGQYVFYAGYCDSQGRMITSYLTSTSKVSVKDPNTDIYQQPELDKLTNYSVKLAVDNLDLSFDYYKVAVLQRSSVDGANSYFSVGVFPTSQNQVLFSGEKNLDRIPIEELTSQLPEYLRAKSVTQANNILFFSDLEARPDPNLQPVVNFIGHFAKWRTVIADEELYSTAKGVANYASYMRDEVNPFSIRFRTNQGYVTPLYPLIPRASTDNDILFSGMGSIAQQIATIEDFENNTPSRGDGWKYDVYSVLETGNGLCTAEERNKKWQFYNTASRTDEELYNTLDCGEELETELKTLTKKCKVEATTAIDLSTPIVLDNFQEEDEFTSFLQYIIDNRGNLPASIDSALDALEASLTCCDGDALFGSKCIDNAELLEEYPVVINNLTPRNNNDEIVTQTTYKPCSYYTRIGKSSSCDMVYTFNVNSNGEPKGLQLNDSTNKPYTPWLSCNETKDPAYFERSGNFYGNTSAANAFQVTPTNYDSVSFNFNIIPLFPPKTDSANRFTLISSIASASSFTLNTNPNNDIITFHTNNRCNGVFDPINSSKIIAEFDLKVHRNAVWYKVFGVTTDSVVLNISEIDSPSDRFQDCLIYSKKLRVSIFDKNLNPVSAQLVNIRNSSDPTEGIICVDTPDQEEFYFAIDSALIEIADCASSITGNIYATGTENCIDVGVHNAVIDTVTVSATGIFDLGIEKTCVYTKDCEVPKSDKLRCDPYPWSEGEFAYWESTNKYPNNDFLYNSYQMVTDISGLGLTGDYLTEFNSAFTDGAGNLDPDKTNFACQQIRHFRFPDFKVSPTIDRNLGFNQDNKIFPIGLHIDNEVISAFLDLAVDNGLIDQEFRDTITHYEIFRGDTRLNRSVVAKGLTYDMFQYEEEGTGFSETTYFSNFPYNDLSPNRLIYTGRDGKNPLEHPDTTDFTNNRYTFHSPETSYEKPNLPFEMYVETYMIGDSKGVFAQVERHPEMVILTEKAFRLARTLTAVEIILEGITNIANITSQFNVGVVNTVGVAIALGLYIPSYFSLSFVKGRLKVEEWLNVFSNMAKPINPAYYYTSVGKYNGFEDERNEGDTTRGLSERLYLNSGRYRINEAGNQVPTVINHYNREKAVYLYTEHNLGIPVQIEGEDNSRFKSSDYGCFDGNVSKEYPSDIASPYISLKQYIPNQYGNINDIEWIYTGYCGELSQDNQCDVIFGGDTYLSRFSVKRKYPFFINAMIDGDNRLPDLSPYNYRQQRNVGYPRYYVDYLSAESDKGFFAPLPDSDYNLDCEDELNSKKRPSIAVQEGSKFYLWYYGIPSFIVESRINNNFRYGENEKEKDFYPHHSDYIEWTQERNVSIREDNYFFYNNIYSTENDLYAYRTLPDNYDPEKWACFFDHWDRTIYSLSDNNEQDLLDNFRIFRANNFFDFGNRYGDFYGLKQIEQQKVIGRFENGMVVFNAFSTIQGSTENYAVGANNIFQNRPTDFFQTELGYGGTQHRAWVSCEFGHFWTDAKRGRIFQVNPNGGGLKEISRAGLKNWFRENLPFRIKKQYPDIPNDVLDNAYDGIGITMTWDDRYSRLFVTKLDVKVKEQYVDRVEIRDKDFFLIQTDGEPVPIHPSDTTYFEDCSWTASYSPVTESWVSFYSFTPNYYVSHQNYFSSGLNWGDEAGLWNHLLGSNQTFQVFYGSLYPWIVEVPVRSNYQTKQFEDFNYRLDVRRYQNEYDYHFYQDNFDSIVFYNDRESTGLLKPKTQDPNDLFVISNYPQYNSSDIEILSTHQDYVWSVNHFYDSLKENHTLPIWKWDANNVTKQLNQQAHDYSSYIKNYMRGQYVIARLEQNHESRLKFIFEHFITDSNMYDAY